MDWLRHMNEAIEYVEENLDGDISYAELAKKAGCSKYHFQRMFSYMAEIPLSEYIRRRKLSCAALELHNTQERVIDIALKYGYDSPTAFTRAFQALHEITPTAARKRGVMLKTYPPITFQVSIKGANVMNYKMEEKDAFRIVGCKLAATMKDNACYEQIPKFWGELVSSRKMPVINSLIGKEPCGMLGVSVYKEPLEDNADIAFDYYVAAATEENIPDGMEEFQIPAATWAIFECIGPAPQSIQEMQKRIATEWLPNSGYAYGNAPDIEVYYDEDGTKPDCRSEVWIPVVKKEA